MTGTPEKSLEARRRDATTARSSDRDGRIGANPIVARCAAFWSAYRAWRRRRATVKALGALDDRTLKDIGIARGEIASVVNGRVDAPLRPGGDDGSQAPHGAGHGRHSDDRTC